MPGSKGLFLILALLPLNLQQMISASADGLTIAIVFAQTAFVLRSLVEKQRFGWKDYLVMTALSLGLVCWKVYYCPMLFLFALIPLECFGTRRRKVLAVASCILGALLILVIWGVVCYGVFFAGAINGRAGQTMSGLSRFLESPGDFVVKMLRAVRKTGLPLLAGVFGFSKAFSWFNVGVDKVLVLASMALTFLVWLIDDGCGLTIRRRASFIVFPAICIFILYFMLYTWWMPAESNYITGFQPRYLLPLLLALSVAIQPIRKKRRKGLTGMLIAAAVLVDFGFIFQILLQTKG